jgi:hypothetical protein
VGACPGYAAVRPEIDGAVLTILEVADALGSDDAADVIDRYVRSIWESWAQHHDTVESWARPFDHSDA